VTKGKVCPQCGTKYDAEHRFCQRDGATLVAENPNESLIGAIIADRYHVLEKLGEGGMGEVYLAEHVRIKRKVAVKVMRRWMSADAVALGRFHREAENASQISHTNVATIYDFGETGDGMVYFAMEYVDGEPLSTILKRETRVGIARACHIVHQVADALAAAHALGILHRDLKPDNVMIGKTRAGTDHVKIVDFGISRVMDRGTQQFTSTGMVIGTPDYMSPEQLAGDAVDARTDNYALALIAFRVLTGAPAFAGSNAQESLLARLTKPAQPLGGALPDVAWPHEMQQVFDRALSADPEDRFLESLEFAVALEEASATAPLTEEDERYLQLLRQRNLTPPRGYGTLDVSTPAFGAPAIGGGLTVPRSRPWTETPPTPTPTTDAAPANARAAATNVPDKGTATGATLPDAAATGTAPAIDAATGAAPPSDPATGAVPEEGALTGSAAAGSLFVPPDAPPAGTLPPVDATPTVEKRPRPVGKLLIAAVIGIAAVFALMRFARPRDEVKNVAAAEEPAAAADPSPITQGSTPVDSVPSAPSSVLRSDAVVSRLSKSVFAVSSQAGHGAGFLADSSGLVITAASLVPQDKIVTVQVDGTHRYHAPVLLSEKGVAVALLPPRVCRACAVIPLDDSTVVTLGDSVVTIGSPESGGRVKRGVVKTSTAQHLTTSFDVSSRHAGAPVASLAASVVALSSRGASGPTSLTPASVLQQMLVRARQVQSTVAPDTISLPVWPVKRMPESERAGGLSFTDKDLDHYRVKKDGFEVLVMTPQVTAWRRTLISRPSSSPDNPFAVTPQRGGDDGALTDPVQRWSEWEEYWRERRAVVMIDVSPEATRPPFHGAGKPVEFKKGDVESVVLMRDGAAVPPIESSRFPSVPDPDAYTGRSVFRSGIAVFPPSVFATGGKFRLDIRDASRDGKTISIDIPSRAVDRIRTDLGGYLER